jgi:hypothetical protein
MSEETNAIKGTPSLLLIPAREHSWAIDNESVQISIPKEGLLSEILKSDTLADGVKIPGDDDFAIIEDKVVYLYQIPRVLFALSKYPQLEDNQAFTLYAIEETDNSVILHGAIIRFV